MKKVLIAASVAVLALTSCRQNDSMVESSNFKMNNAFAVDYSQSTLPVTTKSGDITTNQTWSGVIEIDGVISVKNGATLTIQPGTFIKAKPHADGSATGVLVITKTGKINAVGTASQPIVFTSYNLLDANDNTAAKPGDFGGVVLLGDAPTNMPVSTEIEGIKGADYAYGGTNAAHSAGAMKYVRIEFAGYELITEKGTGNEINGLTLGGVSSGTVIENIQVSYGADDAFEFFGGTVNAKNLIAFAQDDDAFDFDHGYKGTITCALALADYNSTHSLSGGLPDSNGIELDGKQSNATNLSLLTQPTINNLTIVGAKASANGVKYENGIHVRKGGKLNLNDAVVTGYPQGITIESPTTVADLAFTNVKAHGFSKATASVSGTTYTPITISGVTTSVSDPAQLWGMTQPFFNSPSLNLNPRNCGDFQGSWTKYKF